MRSARCLANADLSLQSTKPSTAVCPLPSLVHGACSSRVSWALTMCAHSFGQLRPSGGAGEHPGSQQGLAATPPSASRRPLHGRHPSLHFQTGD